MVGDRTGTVITQQEGFGTAAIPDMGMAEWQTKLKYTEALQKKEADKATEAANQAKLNETPEWWFKHNQELTEGWAAIRQKYAEARARGVQNPFVQDPDFAKEFDRLKNMTENSKNLRIAYGALINDINSAPPGSIDEKSKREALAYYETPLAQLYASGTLQPPLQKQTPLKSTMEILGGAIKDFSAATGNKDWDDKTTTDFTALAGSDPAFMAELMPGYEAWFSQLPQDIQQTALALNGGNPNKLYAEKMKNDIERLKPQKPFDYYQTIKDLSSLAGDIRKVNEYGATTISTTNAEKDVMPSIRKATEMQLRMNDKLLQDVIDFYRIGDGKEIDKEEAIKIASTKLSKAVFDSKNKQASRTLDENNGDGSGSGNAISQSQADEWWKKLIGNDPDAKSLLSGQNYRGGVIDNVEILNKSHEGNRMPWGGKSIRLTMKTNPDDRGAGEIYQEVFDVRDAMHRGLFYDLFYKQKGIERKPFEVEGTPNQPTGAYDDF